MASFFKKLKAAATIGNNDSWSNPEPRKQAPASTPSPAQVQAIRTAKFGKYANNPNAVAEFTKSNAPVQFNAVRAIPSTLKSTATSVGEMAKSLDPLAPVVKPLVNGNIDLAKTGAGLLTGNKQATRNAFNAFKNDYKPAQEVAQNFVTRPVAQIATTAIQPNKQNNVSYHPNKGVEKFVFGERPVQSIQAGVRSNYREHPNLPAPARIGLATGYGVLQVANDAPLIGGATKSVVKGVSKAVKGPGLTNEAMNKRGALMEAYTRSKQANKPESASIYARQIQEIDNTAKSPLQRAITPLKGNQGGYISMGKDGKPFVKVTKDQHLFDNAPPEQHQAIAQKYLNDNFKGKTIQVDGDGNIAIGNRGIGKFTSDSQRLSKETLSDKMRLSTELDNALKVSTKRSTVADRGGRHGSFAKDGFDYRSFKFEVGGKQFVGTVNVAKNGKASNFYDIHPIKELPNKSGSRLSGSPTNGDTVSPNGAPTGTIPNNVPHVNRIRGLDKLNNNQAGFIKLGKPRLTPLKNNQAGFVKVGKGETLSPQAQKVYDSAQNMSDAEIADTIRGLSGYENTPAYQAFKKLADERVTPDPIGKMVVGSPEWNKAVEVRRAKEVVAPKPKVTMNEGRANLVLDKKIRYKGQVMTKRDYLDALSSDGYVPQMQKVNGKTKYVMKSASGDYFDVSKIEHDLAKSKQPLGETPLAKSERLHQEKLAKNNLTQNEYAALHQKVTDLENKASDLHHNVGKAMDAEPRKADGTFANPTQPKVRKAIDDWSKALDEHLKALNAVRKIDGQDPIVLGNRSAKAPVGKQPLGETIDLPANQNQSPLAVSSKTKSKVVPPKQEQTPQISPTPQDGLSTPLAVSPPKKSVTKRPSPQQEIKSEQLNPSSGDTVPQNTLPVHSTKKVGLIDKAFRSTRSIIERQGKAGKELAGMLQKNRDNREVYLAELQKKMPAVHQLARKGRNALVNKDFENFIDATQGLAKPKNPTVAQAVKEWQSVHPSIRDRAVNAGLDVGDLGPTYYPHFIDYDRIFKDKNIYNQSINHLVETGQATDAADAIKKLSYAKDISRNRQFGNLEASREIDLPFYDRTPNSFINYLTGSADRITKTEMFGAKDENALKLIAKAAQEGGDTEAMKNAFDVAIGAKQYNPTSSKVSGAVRGYVTTTRLGLGALTNVSQNVNTGIVTGHLRTLGAAVKQLDPKTRDFVQQTGVISDAILNDIKTQQGYSSFGTKVAGKAVNKVTAPFFGTVEKFNRSVAATAGKDYALRLAQKGDESTLRKLGVTGPIKDKTLTANQQRQAARKIVEKTQFKVDPQDLPGWTDSPGGKLVAQFRTFSYNQSKFVSNEILKPAAKGNLLPLSRMLAALPVGYALYETRRTIDGRPEEEDKTKVALESFSKIGGAGLALDMYRSLNPVGSQYIPTDRRASMATGAFGGPAVGIGIQGIGAVSDAIQRKNTPKDPTTLDGKVAIANTGDKYTDVTGLARFGMSQVPVIGTPIKNRVLPYKKESQASSGNTAVSAGGVTTDNKKPWEDPKTMQTMFGKDFTSLTNDDKRKEWASKSPDNKAIYDKYQAMKTQMNAKPADDIPESLKNTTAGAFTKKLNGFTKEGKDSWYKQAPSEKDKALYDAANAVKGKDWLDLPKSNQTIADYIAYQKKVSKATTNFEKQDAAKEFVRDTYKQYLPENARKLFSGTNYNEDQKLAAIASGELTQDDFEKALQLDNMMYEKGLSSSLSISKKIRSKYGYGTPSKSGGGSGRRSSGGRKKSNIKLSDFSVADIYKTTSSHRKKLRDLLEQAKV